MNRIHVAVAIALSLAGDLALAQAASGPVAAAGAPVKPGLWETTIVVENAAASSRRSVLARSCVTAADAKDPSRMVPPQREPGMQCENRDVKREGATIAWTIACKSADATHKGTGKLSIAGDSYLGRAEVEQQKKGAKPVKLGQTFSGKWVQACT